MFILWLAAFDMEFSCSSVSYMNFPKLTRYVQSQLESPGIPECAKTLIVMVNERFAFVIVEFSRHKGPKLKAV